MGLLGGLTEIINVNWLNSDWHKVINQRHLFTYLGDCRHIVLSAALCACSAWTSITMSCVL